MQKDYYYYMNKKLWKYYNQNNGNTITWSQQFRKMHSLRCSDKNIEIICIQRHVIAIKLAADTSLQLQLISLMEMNKGIQV